MTLTHIEHLTDTTCVSPSPACPAGCCPLNFLFLINLKLSSLGLIKVLYATSLVLVVAKAKFLRRKPSALVALEEISEMCWPQSILSEMVISRYLADWTFPKFSCEGNNQREFVCNADAESIYDRVTLIEWHLATLNFICQWLATDRRPYVIRQVIYKSKEQDRSYIPPPPLHTHTHFQT